MWNRSFGRELAKPFERYCMCKQLQTTLAMLGVKHLVVGHTPQARPISSQSYLHDLQLQYLHWS